MSGMEVLWHGSFWAQWLGHRPSPAAALPLLPPEKGKQSKLQRRAPNTKAVSSGLNPANTIKYEIPTALYLPRAALLKVMDTLLPV